MSKPDCPLVPVFGETGCVGHLLKSAKGFRAFDAADKQIGVYESSNSAIAGHCALIYAAHDRRASSYAAQF